MADPYFDYERDYPLGDPRRRLLGARYEDEDEAEAPNKTPPVAAQAPTRFPASSNLAALLPQPDADMDARWRQAETQALDLAGQGGSYGWAEGVRDFAPMAVGGLLDILVNKGRGLGALAAGGMQAIASQQGRRDDRQKEAAKQALLMRQQRESGADRAIQAHHAMLRGAELEQRIAEMQARAQQAASPEERDKALAEIALLKAQANKAQADADWAGMDDIIRIMQTGSLEQRQEAALALKKRQIENQERKTAADEERNRLEREAREQVAAEKAETQRQETRAKNIRQFNRDTEKVQKEAHAVRELTGLLRKYAGSDLPGQGSWDSRKPNFFTSDDGVRVKQLTADLLTSEILEATGKASREKEESRITAIHGLGKDATAREFAIGIRAFGELLQDRLRGYGSAYESDARDALREARLEDFVYGPTPQAVSGPRPPPSAAPGAAAAPAPAPASGAAPSGETRPPPPANPAGRGRELNAKEQSEYQALFERIPEEQKESVQARLGDLSATEQLEFLRGLDRGGSLNPKSKAGPANDPLGGIPGVTPVNKKRGRR